MNTFDPTMVTPTLSVDTINFTLANSSLFLKILKVSLDICVGIKKLITRKNEPVRRMK